MDRVVAEVPQSEVAERAVLGALILDPERADDLLAELGPADFLDPGRRVVFEASRSLYRDARTVSVELLHERLLAAGELERAGGARGLAGLLESDVAGKQALELARELRGHRVRRELLRAAGDIASLARRLDVPAEQLAGRAEARILEAADADVRQDDGLSIGEAALQALERIGRARETGGPMGLPTGLEGLDRLTGGMRPGQLWIGGGDTSSGKTSLAVGIARHLAAEGRRVVFYSFEMGGTDIGERVLLQEAGIGLTRAKRRDLGQADIEKLHRAAARLQRAPLKIVPASDLSATDLRARARREVRRGNARLVVVDYLQLVPGDGGDTREQEVSGVTRELGRMARELQVPVLALAQINRSHAFRSGDHRPQLSDLRESGAIEQNADVVLFVYRPGRYRDPTEPEFRRERDAAELIVAKQRQGPLGTVRCRFRGELYRFEEVRPDEEASARREKVRT